MDGCMHARCRLSLPPHACARPMRARRPARQGAPALHSSPPAKAGARPRTRRRAAHPLRARPRNLGDGRGRRQEALVLCEHGRIVR